MTFNLATMLRESAAAYPDKPFCLAGDDVHTFAEIDAASARIGAGLRDAGLAPGDRVAVQLTNSPEFISTYFGILKAGCVMVPLNPQLTPREIEYQIADCGAGLLLTEDAPLPDPPAGTLANIPKSPSGKLLKKELRRGTSPPAPEEPTLVRAKEEHHA